MSVRESVEPRAVSEAEVRTVLEKALGDPRLSSVGLDKPLLRSGVITSIELVSVLVDLERAFEVTIPQSAAPQMSIGSILRALGGEAAAAEPEPEPDALLRRLRAASRRPSIFLASIVCCFLLLDLAVRRAVEGPLTADYRVFSEEGRRFYAYTGEYSQDSFRFALRHHEISAAPPALPQPEGLHVAVFGDSGTIGTYVPVDQAIPARLEAALRDQGTRAKVWNLAWYGRLLAKDYMLLDLVWDQQLDVVVFTLSDDHLRKSSVDAWIDRYRHITFNWQLFDHFKDRLPAEEQAPFREIVGHLRRADLIHQGPLRRWEYEQLALMPYQPFLRYLATVRWLPERFDSSMRAQMTAGALMRCAEAEPPPRVPAELTAADLDRTQVDMLVSVIRALQRRGVRTVLYVEPLAPREQRVDRALSAASVAAGLARETGSLFVDETWALGKSDFIDSLAHFTPDANRRIGEALSRALRSKD